MNKRLKTEGTIFIYTNKMLSLSFSDTKEIVKKDNEDDSPEPSVTKSNVIGPIIPSEIKMVVEESEKNESTKDVKRKNRINYKKQQKKEKEKVKKKNCVHYQKKKWFNYCGLTS
jgi:hypothetical protein